MRRSGQRQSRCALTITLLGMLLGVLASFAWRAPGVAAGSPPNYDIEDAAGDLTEIKDRRRVALLIVRSSVLDASGSEQRILTEALAAKPRDALKHRYAYGTVARKLNQYMRKYRSLRPVEEIAEADFIIYFKLVEYRRQLNGYYPFGELFIIVNPRPEDQGRARIIWKTKKVMFAEDAVRDFVKELKRVRQER